MRKKQSPNIDDIPEYPPALSEETQAMTMVIAKTIRGAMEDFQVKYLSEDQMQELNPIIRDAVATALYAYHNRDTNPLADAFVDMQSRTIPRYWEPPKLLREFSRQSFEEDVRRGINSSVITDAEE